MEEKPYQDIPMGDLKKHLRNISKAITDARKDLAKYKVTRMNESVYVQLKRSQDEIDALISAAAFQLQCVVNGHEVHGYSLICYKVGKDYYGLKQFGHAYCERIAQEHAEIPVEEFLVFRHQISKDTKCEGCHKPVLPVSQEDENETP